MALFTFSRVLTQDLKTKADLLLDESSDSRSKLHVDCLEGEASGILTTIMVSVSN